MSRAPLIVIADDLTGAAEIAAIGHRCGLTASVVSDGRLPADETDLIVFDTDSRLDDARTAAAKITALSEVVVKLPRAFLYKKTDSVLRGPVRAELEALARGLGFPRILLVPANPALGRTVQSGRYRVGGVPLHETAFALDPHHPAKTDDVRQLLDPDGMFSVNTADSRAMLPAAGIFIGDAASPAEMTAWPRHAASDVLTAGAAEFFSALLRDRGFSEQPHPAAFAAQEPVLVISGTTSPAGARLRQDAGRAGMPIVRMPGEALRETAAATDAIQEWAHAAQIQLAGAGRVLAVFDGPVSPDAAVADAIRRAFARLTAELVKHRVVRHLVVEGGATAATIVRELGWRELRLVHEWSPGVASLRSAGGRAADLTLTLKPGSYAWPAALWQNLISSSTKSLHA